MQQEKIDVKQFIEDMYRLLPELLRQEPEFALVIKDIVVQNAPHHEELIRLLDKIGKHGWAARYNDML